VELTVGPDSDPWADSVEGANESTTLIMPSDALEAPAPALCNETHREGSPESDYSSDTTEGDESEDESHSDDDTEPDHGPDYSWSSEARNPHPKSWKLRAVFFSDTCTLAR
jgi:hypothetical protein